MIRKLNVNIVRLEKIKTIMLPPYHPTICYKLDRCNGYKCKPEIECRDISIKLADKDTNL